MKNIEHYKSTVWMSLLAVTLVFASVNAIGGDLGDVGYVTKDDALPNETVKSKGDIERIKPLLETLPKGHRLRLEFTAVPSVTTGYKEDIRYVSRVTSINSRNKPDGPEVIYTDWYRHSAQTSTYKNGLLDGTQKQFDVQSGALVGEVPWVNGKIHGVKRTFYVNGKLANETVYENDVIKGASRSYSDEGKIIRIVHYANGERHGETKDYWWDKSDAVKRIIPYRNGKVEGVAKAFYLNGKLKWERPFKANLQHGVEKHYAGDGAVEKTIYWLKGEQVTAEAYRKTTGTK